MDAAAEFLEPWYVASAPELASELQRELNPGHVLSGKPVITLARRQDCDDVLVGLLDGTGRVAEVRLTRQPEADHRRPRTTLFPCMEAWRESM